jgi:hypothetical protein
MVSYMCYFFAVPLGVLIPVSQTGIDLSWVSVLANILLAIGVCGLGAILLIRILDLLR